MEDTERNADAPTVPGAAARELARGALIGRYVVLERIGAGGMGVVYGAYDPELERKVALKLVHADDAPSATARARLVREAQAMAKITHPSVVTVHDVGTLGDDVYIAMEFVEGGTLRRWMSEPRHWRDVVGKFVGAGRGLAAAHALGLVHRDFKPDNVLLRKDGSACVTDFGLAVLGPHEPAPVETPTPSPTSARSSGSLTTAGVILGTPAYMAPEQLKGERVDALSDQFSFCVALYEALFAVRPFGKKDTEARIADIDEGRLRAPDPNRRVPAWLRALVVRGLSPRPEARHSSMEALVDEMERRAARTPARWLLWGAAAAIGLAAVLGVRARHDALARECAASAREMDGVWDPARKERARLAFSATRRGYAEQSFRAVDPALDAYAASWVAMRAESCEATRLRGTQSPELYAARALCLDQRMQELRALTDLFVAADGPTVEASVGAAAALTPVAACGDVAALTSRVRRPDDAAQRASVDRIRADLARAKALTDAGKHKGALDVARQALASARETGHRPVISEALVRIAVIERTTLDFGAAEATLSDAVNLAEASADDEAAAEAWVNLVRVYAWQRRKDWAELAVARAEAALERVPWATTLKDDLAVHRGYFLMAAGRRADSVTHLRAHAGALEKRLGAKHPAVALALFQLSRALSEAAAHQEAADVALRALSIQKEQLGEDHPLVAASMRRLAAAYVQLGRVGEAEALLARALAIFTASYGDEHPHVAITLTHLGPVRARLGRHDEGLALARRGVAILERAYGADDNAALAEEGAIADILLRHGDFAEAKVASSLVLRSSERTAGPDHFETLRALVDDARADLGLGKKEHALATFERVLERRTGDGAPAEEIAEASFLVAQALSALGRDLPRAARLAERARDLYASIAPVRQEERREVDRWLAPPLPRR